MDPTYPEIPTDDPWYQGYDRTTGMTLAPDALRMDERMKLQSRAMTLVMREPDMALVQAELYLWNQESFLRPFPRADVVATAAAVHLVCRAQGALPNAPRKTDAEAFRPVRDIIDERPEEGLDWLLEGLLPKGYLAVLGGTSKAGKSVFVTALAIAVACGEPFIGCPCPHPAAVLWCAYEESVTERLQALAPHGEIPENFLLMADRLAIDDPAALRTLRTWIERTDARLLVVDSLYAAHSQEGLSDGQSARRALRGLKDLAATTGCAVIVIHHINKNVGIGMTRDRMADSNQILATASMDWLMNATPNGRGTSREIHISARGRGDFANREWNLLSEGPTSFRLRDSPNEEGKLLSRNLLSVMEELGSSPSLTAREIAEALALPGSTCRTALRSLVALGRVVADRAEGKGNTLLYRLANPPDPRL